MVKMVITITIKVIIINYGYRMVILWLDYGYNHKYYYNYNGYLTITNHYGLRKIVIFNPAYTTIRLEIELASTNGFSILVKSGIFWCGSRTPHSRFQNFGSKFSNNYFSENWLRQKNQD